MIGTTHTRSTAVPQLRTYSVAVSPPITVGAGGVAVSGLFGLFKTSQVQSDDPALPPAAYPPVSPALALIPGAEPAGVSLPLPSLADAQVGMETNKTANAAATTRPALAGTRSIPSSRR
ncbi:MAG: hypothetical protein NVS9B11_20220 [Candidatus Dormibacteraceae bacterium]